MKVLTFAATNSRNSINKKLVKFAASKLTNAKIDYVDINDFDSPIYSIDLENDFGIPDAAYQFQSRIEQADAILVSFAEHNGNFSGARRRGDRAEVGGKRGAIFQWQGCWQPEHSKLLRSL